MVNKKTKIKKLKSLRRWSLCQNTETKIQTWLQYETKTNMAAIICSGTKGKR